MFASPRQALRAAVDLQERFVEETIADPSIPLGVGVGLDVGEAVPVDDGYRMRGEVVMRGRTCTVEGLAGVSVDSGRELRLHGSLRLDIRDFGIQPPRLLLLRVHPEVDVVLDFVALADGVAPG